MQKNGSIEYIYYEIVDDEIKDVEDKEVLEYLQSKYRENDPSIIY